MIKKNLLHQFEEKLNPQKLKDSPIPATILGYGEISTIFQIGDDDSIAYKRMPLFANRAEAEKYSALFQEYCQELTVAGLHLPSQEVIIIEVPQRPVSLYIAQQQLPGARFGHKLIQMFDRNRIQDLFELIVMEIDKVWQFNKTSKPGLELALDGQLSNWVYLDNVGPSSLLYIDTSTPLLRKNGVEQLDPELLLQSAPSFLRWIIRSLFLDDVMNRYYDARSVYIDLAANLFKEQRSDLIPLALDCINEHRAVDIKPITSSEVQKYYKTDKLIWTLFLAFRRVDLWLTTKLFRQRYEFILPKQINR
ncbi:DUF6206 family protein [candidate division CSSED10-310 bacterium]|uniref:DUF6206 family protein n=1 Tax=candidate division CSSED10-310 bacterium TaxID=2855610 RepID=A0ABV6YRX2_UNCC1